MKEYVYIKIKLFEKNDQKMLDKGFEPISLTNNSISHPFDQSPFARVKIYTKSADVNLKILLNNFRTFDHISRNT